MLRELRRNIDVLSFAAARLSLAHALAAVEVASGIDRRQKKNFAVALSFIDGSVTRPVALNTSNLTGTNAYTHAASAQGRFTLDEVRVALMRCGSEPKH
jgi:hypothetical protein